MKRYTTENHDWISVQNNNLGVVGITTQAQKELGPIVYVKLPQVGRFIKAGEEVVILESTKAAADVYAPVSGKITKINELLQHNPGLINQDAENTGWLYELELSDVKELTSFH